MGGAVEQILKEIFQTHADPEWRIKVAGSDVGTPVDVALSTAARTPRIRSRTDPERGRTGGGKDGASKCGRDGTDGGL